MEKTLSTRNVYKGQAISVRVLTVAKPNGTRTTRDIVDHSPVIVAVPIDGDGNVVMVRQYRKAVEKSLLELPAGGIENGEAPENCVKRELQEEIGFLPQHVERLGGFFAAPGYTTEYMHLFLATDLVKSQLQAEDTDEIEIVRKPLSQVPALIASGEIEDAKSIAGLLQFICLGKET
jgi:ADP-ribose pyrophosphatase